MNNVRSGSYLVGAFGENWAIEVYGFDCMLLFLECIPSFLLAIAKVGNARKWGAVATYDEAWNFYNSYVVGKLLS